MVRSQIEYCVQLWSPLPAHGNWKLILDLENIQRRFTRMIDNVGMLPYKERLEKLGLTTLLERRARGDLIETFKILNGIAKYGKNLFKLSRSGDKLVSRPGDQHGLKHSFFPRRKIQYWNKLPSYVKSSKSVDSFKNNLAKLKGDHLRDSGHYLRCSHIINHSNEDILYEKYHELQK